MEKYTKEQIESVVKQNFSIAKCLIELGLRPAGGNYKWFHKRIKKYCIDTSHFTGQGWNNGKKFDYSSRRLPLEEILVLNSEYTSSNFLRIRLIKEGVKKHQCEVCLNTEWNGKPIPIELEHCNGDNTDNRIENLKILCPNCHAQTDFYRGRNKLNHKAEKRKTNPPIKKQKNENPEIKKKIRELRPLNVCGCGQIIDHRAKQCKSCFKLSQDTKRPPYSQLVQDFEELKSFVQVGLKYDVSDNAVRKWVKLYKMDV
jgi:hypothetical protein